MKRMKALKAALIGIFIVAVACCVFTACKSKVEEEGDKPESTPTGITLSIEDVKRTYLTFQSFSSDGIKATVSFEDDDDAVVEGDELSVDYSAFDNSTPGEYKIVVSYTGNDKTVESSYVVEVIEEIVGLKVVKTVVDYPITSASNIDIDLSDMAVYAVDGNGEATTPLGDGEYEIKYYRNGTEIASVNDVGTGVYTIYVYRDVTIIGKYSEVNYECGAYVIVYVTDTLESSTPLALDTGSVTTQDLNIKDVMTDTWTFTLTYASGNTKKLTAADVEITGINTKEATGDGGRDATVKYTEEYVSSAERYDQNAQITVGYTIQAGTGQQVSTYTYSYEELETTIYTGDLAGSTADVELSAEYFTGSNSFLTYVGSSSNNKIRPGTSSGIIEIRDAALAVTFGGFGSITLEFFSTSGTNTSEIGLQNSERYFLKGEVSGSAVEDELIEGNGYYYAVTGNSDGSKVTFEVEEPGTYIITGDFSGEYSRNTRIRSIEMTDIYYSDEDGSVEPTSLMADPEALSLGEKLDLENIDLSLPRYASLFGTCNDSERDS